MHKRQRVDAWQTVDRKKFESVIQGYQESAQDVEKEEDDEQEMAGPSLDLFFPQKEESPE